MDKDRLKKLYTEALNLSYSGRISITEFVVLPTHEYNNEKNEWIQSSYSLFVGLKKPTDYVNNDDWRGVDKFLENFFGFECVVNFD